MIALDALGGDFAPRAALEGAIVAARAGVSITLCGPRKQLEQQLVQIERQWETLPLFLLDAPREIGMAEEPVTAVRTKPDSSLVRAVQLVKAGKADTVISAGNSGAIMAAALLILGREPGIERPAIAGLIPTIKRPVVALDLGANVSCKPHYLYQFGVMGSRYARQNLAIERPRVGILSNGSERGKGTDLVKQAALLLEESPLNFIGNIEPLDVIHNRIDVLVCDGFSGNILLKTLEATVDLAERTLSELLPVEESSDRLLDKIREKLYHGHAGGGLLGVNGSVIVLHGDSTAETIARALIAAADKKNT